MAGIPVPGKKDVRQFDDDQCHEQRGGRLDAHVRDKKIMAVHGTGYRKEPLICRNTNEFFGSNPWSPPLSILKAV